MLSPMDDFHVGLIAIPVSGLLSNRSQLFSLNTKPRAPYPVATLALFELSTSTIYLLPIEAVNMVLIRVLISHRNLMEE
jgi:hypothetical protein